MTGYPFAVPAARGGRAPSVGLSYSSDGSVHGGVAAGWTLAAGGVIAVDGSAGTVRPEWPDGGSAGAPRNFTSPAGLLARDDTLPRSEPGAVTYRAISDASSTRFEYHAGTRSPYWWTVLYSDGSSANFGLKEQHPWSFSPLVRVASDDGNSDPQELKYSYTTVGRTTAAPTADQPREFVLSQIAYEAPGEDEPYAKVSFHYADPVFCGNPAVMPALGSRSSYRLGFAQLSGTRKLTEVRSWTKRRQGTGFDLRDLFSLGYNAETEACGGQAAIERGVPFRELAEVRRTTYRPQVAGQDGPDTTVLPATKFTYGKAGSYVKSSHYGPETTVGAANLALPESIETNQQAAVAYDGDNPGASVPVFREPFASCEDVFCPVPREPGVADPTDVPDPTNGAWLLATGQSNGESVGVVHVDVNGDNRPDMLKRRGGVPKLAAATPQTGGCEVDVYLKQSTGYHKSSAFDSFSLAAAMGDIPVKASTPPTGEGELLCSLNRSFSSDASGGFRGDAGVPCAQGEGWGATARWGSMQQARHAFFDWDGDGLQDLVTQTIASVDCPYASTHGVSAPTYFPRITQERGAPEPDPNWVPEYLDDAVGVVGSHLRAITKRQKYMYVYRNTGTGFAEAPVRVEASSQSPPSGPLGEGLHYDNVAKLPEATVMAGFSGKGDRQGVDGDPGGPKTQMSDLNGDGHLDLWFRQRGTNLGPAPRVADSAGRWPNVEFPTAEQWRTSFRVFDDSEDPDPLAPGQWTVASVQGMQTDVNGDGLPDLIEHDDTRKGTKVSFNTGFGFATADEDGQVFFSEDVADTAYLDSFRVGRLSGETWHGYAPIGERWDRTGMRDHDGDAIPDLLFYDHEGDRAALYSGGGRQWVSAHDADPEVARYLAGVVRGVGSGYGGTIQELDDRADYRYLATHQAVDVDGDGLRDLVGDTNSDGVVSVRYAKPVLGGGDRAAPARLMRTMTNGTGATTTVSYTRDAKVGKWLATSTTVDPGHGQPAITTDHHYLKPAFTPNAYGRKTFRGYGEVHTKRNTSTPGVADNATDVTRYDYSQTPGGIPTLAATVLGQAVNAAGMPDDQPGVMSVTTYTHQLRPVGARAPGMRADYPIYVALPETTVTRTCTGAAGQTLAACRATAPAVTQQTAWEPRADEGRFATFLPTVSETRFTNSAGKTETHRTTPTFHLRWTNTAFTVAPETTATSVRIDGTETALGEVRYAYADADNRFVQTVTTHDAVTKADKVTRLAYYRVADGPKRGLIKRFWQPEQVHRHNVDTDSDPGYSEVDYDADGVHAVRVTNPLGHTATTVVDPGTGQPLEAQGPNYSCPDGPDPGAALDPPASCDFDAAAAAGLAELTRVHVDGLGRPVKTIVHPIGDSDRSSGVETFRATYNDLAYEQSPAAARVPTSVVTQELIADRAGLDPLYTHTTTTVDGFGRTLRTRGVQDSEVTRQIDYAYDAQGLLARLTGPRGDGGADKRSSGTVSLINTYDGLGRPTSIADQLTDADGRARPADVSQTWTYDGLSTTSAQVVDDESAGRRKTVTTDVVGRLATVVEKWNPFHGDAVTRYDHTAPTKTTITDAEGVVTTVTHDFSGNRTGVARSGRTWSYGYDRNGNPTTVTEPHPADATRAQYTHTLVYDDLDRLTASIPAPRDLTEAEKAEFAFGPTTYAYDTAHPSLDTEAGHANATIGRLTHTQSVTADPDPAKDPVVTALVTTRFNEWGAPEALDQRLPLLDDLAGVPGLEGLADRLAVTITADDAGVAESTRYTARDGAGRVGFSGPAVHATGFDRDGTPTATRIDLDAGTMGIALERNAAGLAVTRRTDTEGVDTYADPQMRYTHDGYGRVTSMQAAFPDDSEPCETNPVDPGTQRYKQTLDYYDNGQVKSITEQLGNAERLAATTTYSYNHRHELEIARQEGEKRDGRTGGVGYYAHIATTAGGRLDFANVATLHPTESPTRLTPRTVDYQYGADGDPLRLAALRYADGSDDGAELADYGYDQAGNTSRRTINTPGGGSTTYTQRWDGPSSLRKVTNENTGDTETYFPAPGGRVAVHRAADGTVTQVRRDFGAQEIVYAPNQPARYRQSITLAGEIIGRVEGDSATGTFEHFLTSPQGHHVLALDTCGGTQRVVSYGAFAEVLQELTASTNLLGDKYDQEFNGKTFDEVSGLHDYGARSFDPLALSWSSPDPLYTGAPDLSATEPTRANLYTYTANNAINMVDPSGFDSTCVFGDCASTDFPDGAGETIVMEGTAPQPPANPADWGWLLPAPSGAYQRVLAAADAAEAGGVREFVPPPPGSSDTFTGWLLERTPYPDPLTNQMEPNQTNLSRLISNVVNTLHTAKEDSGMGHASPRGRIPTGRGGYGTHTVGGGKPGGGRSPFGGVPRSPSAPSDRRAGGQCGAAGLCGVKSFAIVAATPGSKVLAVGSTSTPERALIPELKIGHLAVRNADGTITDTTLRGNGLLVHGRGPFPDAREIAKVANPVARDALQRIGDRDTFSEAEYIEIVKAIFTTAPRR